MGRRGADGGSLETGLTARRRAEAVLRAMSSLTRVCGELHLDAARLALVAALCAACLPEQYNAAAAAADPPGAKGWAVRFFFFARG